MTDSATQEHATKTKPPPVHVYDAKTDYLKDQKTWESWKSLEIPSGIDQCATSEALIQLALCQCSDVLDMATIRRRRYKWQADVRVIGYDRVFAVAVEYHGPGGVYPRGRVISSFAGPTQPRCYATPTDIALFVREAYNAYNDAQGSTVDKKPE